MAGSLWTSKLLYDSSMSGYWGNQTLDTGTEVNSLTPDKIRGSLMSCIFTRSAPASLSEDIREFSYRLAIEAGPGAPMVPLTATQAGSVETAFLARWTSQFKPQFSSDYTFKEFQWRDWGADFPRDKNGLTKSGPIWRVTNVAQLGTNAQFSVLDQAACSVTFKTSSRKHWGRIYLPGAASSWWATASKGRLQTTVVDAFAQAHADFFNALAALPAITAPWIYSPKYRGAFSIKEIHVDDIADVIRSRRPKFVAYRKSLTS